MKFLISNYSTPWFTEPYYFNAGLELLKDDKINSYILDTKYSIYDNFDKIKPNVYITHVSHISKDLIYYLSTNDGIKLVININGASDEYIEQVYNTLTANNILHIFFGDRVENINNFKYIKIGQAADTFIPIGDIKYKIQKLIFINDKEDIIERDGTYHYTSIAQELSNSVDFSLPITSLNSIFHNYDEIIFKGSFYIGSQISFNAIYSGSKVIFDTKDKDDLEKIDSIFKNEKLLSSVKNRHTGLHRLKSLLSQLSYTDIAKKLEDRINNI